MDDLRTPMARGLFIFYYACITLAVVSALTLCGLLCSSFALYERCSSNPPNDLPCELANFSPLALIIFVLAGIATVWVDNVSQRFLSEPVNDRASLGFGVGVGLLIYFSILYLSRIVYSTLSIG
jgi:hypothetical protein